MNKHTCIALVVAAMMGSTARAELAMPAFDHDEAALVGVYVKNINTNTIVMESNAYKAMTPASILKCLSAATALTTLGADYRFETQCYLRGSRDAVDESRWVGDLVIAGSADPTLESQYFPDNLGLCDSIAVALTRLGVTSITGTIEVLGELPGGDFAPSQWELEDIPEDFGAYLRGVNYRDNVFTLWPATGDTEPMVPGLAVNVSAAPYYSLRRGEGSYDVYITAPESRITPEWKMEISMPNPAEVLAADLATTLELSGIEVEHGDVLPDPTSDEEVQVLKHQSPRLAEVIRSTLVRSDNMFAEGLLRVTAPDSTLWDAIDAECKLWTERGVDMATACICDGSGLARSDKIAPRTIGTLLEWMAKNYREDDCDFASLLPMAGRDGTMRSFLRGEPKLASSIVFKTGSMGGVQCYAGYHLDANGQPDHVVVMMFNSFVCTRAQVRAAAEQLMRDIFRQ